MECQECHLNFNTPPVREPRRFKCRGCGTVFVVRPPVPASMPVAAEPPAPVQAPARAPSRAAARAADEEDGIVTLETNPGLVHHADECAVVVETDPGSGTVKLTDTRPVDPCATTYPALGVELARPARPAGTPAVSSPSPSPSPAPAPLEAPPGGGVSLDPASISIPGFEVESLIGAGGMGCVFRARQVSLDRPVAVKVLSPALAAIPRFVKRFNKEARALSQLSHPGIVGVIDRGQAGGILYLVMEYVPGTTLRYLLQKVQLTLRDFLDMVMQLLEALDYLHAKGIVHRDIKPENIIIAKNRRLKLADFGLACLLDPEDSAGGANLTRQHSTMGTLNYMAPEQRVDASSVDCRADIYSMGVILYEIVTAELPVGAFDPPSKVNPRLSRRMDDIIMKALRPKPADRYATAREMLDDLRGYVENVRKKPGAEDEGDKPVSTIRVAPGKKSHTVVPGSSGAAFDAQEEQRLWAVWQDQAKAAADVQAARPAARRPKVAQKGSAPVFYEAALADDAALERGRRRSKVPAYAVAGAVIAGVGILLGALLLPVFPFLWRIPLVGSLMMGLRNILVPPM